MKVLKDLISREAEDIEEDGTAPTMPKDSRDIQYRLLCIVTAFELLSGQGEYINRVNATSFDAAYTREALNIDLSDFTTRLYSIILPLSLMHDIEAPPSTSFKSDVRGSQVQSVADMLFRALNIVFSPKSSGTASPPWRSAAFAKRLLTASLNWPTSYCFADYRFHRGFDRQRSESSKRFFLQRTVPWMECIAQTLNDPQLCNPFGTFLLGVTYPSTESFRCSSTRTSPRFCPVSRGRRVVGSTDLLRDGRSYMYTRKHIYRNHERYTRLEKHRKRVDKIYRQGIGEIMSSHP